MWTLRIPAQPMADRAIDGLKTVETSRLNSDLFSNGKGGLGRSRQGTYDTLVCNPGRTAQQLADLREINVETVRAHLRVLRKNGLARKAEHLQWFPCEDVDQDRLAKALGVSGRLAMRTSRVELDRTVFDTNLKKIMGDQ